MAGLEDPRKEPGLGLSKSKDFLDIVPDGVDGPDLGEWAERKRSKSKKPKAVLIGVLIGVAVAAGAGWYIFSMLSGGMDDGGSAVPLVTADKGPVKERPEEPGGMEVPNRDRKVYESLGEKGTEGGSGSLRQETLTPPPQPKLPEPKAPEPPAQLSQAKPTLPPPPAATTSGGEELFEETAPPPAKVAPPAEPPPPPKELAAPASPPPAAVPPKAEPQTAAKPAEAAPATQMDAAQSALSGDYLVQLLAARDATAAEREWTRLSKAHNDLLGALGHVVVRADLGAKGIYFRLRTGPFADKAAASALCESLKKRSQGCLVVPNK